MQRSITLRGKLKSDIKMLDINAEKLKIEIEKHK